MEFCNILKYLRSCLWKTPGEIFWSLQTFGVQNPNLENSEESHLWGMFVSSTLCLLVPLFLDRCPQIKEIYPPLWFFEYACLNINIRYRTLDFMYCQNSQMQRSLSSYAEVGTKSVWFLLLEFGETEGKWNKQMS